LYQLGVLRGALDQLDALHEQWLITRDSLPADAKPGTSVYDDALAEHHAECWSYLDDWANHGQALSEIHSAARHVPASTPPPAATATRPTSPTAQVRR
jgi:hypothetical protein